MRYRLPDPRRTLLRHCEGAVFVDNRGHKLSENRPGSTNSNLIATNVDELLTTIMTDNERFQARGR